MRYACKAACLLLALVQLAPPAFAQSAPATAAPPADALPPETAPRLPAVPPPPDFQPHLDRYPLSSQILLVNLTPFQVTRGGIAIPDLSQAVAGSPLAANLVKDGESEVATGHIVSGTGLVLWIGAIVASFIMVGAYGDHPTTAQTNAAGATLFFGVLGGITVELVGDGIRAGGRNKILQGVNAYNAELLDGRLSVPSYRPAP